MPPLPREPWPGVFLDGLYVPLTGLEFMVILLPQPPQAGSIGMHHHAWLAGVFLLTRLGLLILVQEDCRGQMTFSAYFTKCTRY